MTQSVCDVSDRAAVGQLFRKRLRRSAGSIASSTMPASPGPTGRVDEIDPADWDTCVAIDLTGSSTAQGSAIWPRIASSSNEEISLFPSFHLPIFSSRRCWTSPLVNSATCSRMRYSVKAGQF